MGNNHMFFILSNNCHCCHTPNPILGTDGCLAIHSMEILMKHLDWTLVYSFSPPKSKDFTPPLKFRCMAYIVCAWIGQDIYTNWSWVLRSGLREKVNGIFLIASAHC